MNHKARLQFLIMMIPTLLLLVAAAVTLAVPARAATQPSSLSLEARIAPEAGIDPVQTVFVR